ncbi:MAG TPA: hypothetical protein DCZ12_12080 [Gammaproteobacteria bacterium]|nr:hypothetical protein [Gammaproteobacteria bacterium]
MPGSPAGSALIGGSGRPPKNSTISRNRSITNPLYGNTGKYDSYRAKKSRAEWRHQHSRGHAT